MPEFIPTTPFGTEPDHPAPADHTMVLSFTGSGSEYFRIWMVNTVLTVLTLTLYYPWAKCRRLRYFHGNTLVDGYPLDFHGNPKKMLRGYLLVAALLGVYTVANRTSPLGGLVAVSAFAALWPALMRASLQFRLANTSWRGLRLRFVGDLRGAYAAMLPLFLPALAIFAATALAPQTPAGQAGMGFWVLGVSALTLGVLPWLLFRLKRYQHRHYAIADQQTDFSAGARHFYGLWAKTIGVVLLTAVIVGIVGIALAWTAGRSAGNADERSPWMVLLPMLLVLLVYATMLLTAGPYYLARMQNLLWNHTASADLRFESRLRFWPTVKLSAKNLALVLITLGLYWPFARIAMARLRLEAMAITSGINPEHLAARGAGDSADAAGDAAGDLFGFDVGL